MIKKLKITCLFIDIGGVLLSNGWGHEFRNLVAIHFKLNYEEMEERHKSNIVIYEEGKITLEEYLNRIVFFEKRSFTFIELRDFIFSQTTPNKVMIQFVKKLKEKYKLKIVVVSNEGKELNEYRIKKFGLTEFVDMFISSCYIHLRKPDVKIFRLALDIAQVPIEQIVYIDDVPMFIEVASSIGIRSFQFKNNKSTYEDLATLGLMID